MHGDARRVALEMTAGDHRRPFDSVSVRAGWIVAIAAAITAWIFSRGGTPFAGYDWIELEVFNKHLYRAALLSGHLPLWNPFVGLGRPFLADIDTATLYPPNLLFLLPDAWALPLCVAFHTALILAGMSLLGRDLNLSWRAMLLAGVTFALSAPLTARLQAGQIQVFCTFAWLPLWWALGWRAWREPSLGAMVAFAAATAMTVFAGSPPLFWAMSWVLLAWLAAWAAGQPWRATLRGAMAVLTGGVAGLGLAAVQLVPFFELAQQGNRPLHDPTFANLGALPVRNLASLFVPSTDALRFYWEMNLFTGILAPLGLVALVFAWRDRTVRAFAVVALCGLLLALEPLKLPGLLTGWLPGMGALRLPSRYAIVVGWALVMVVLLAWRERKSRGAAWMAAGTGVVHLGTLLWAVDAQAAQYAVATRPAAESQIAARVVQLATSTAPVPLRVALARDAVRSNAGVLHGFSNLESFASPGLARVWEAAHALAGIPPRAGDLVHTADLAVQPREALIKWGVQFGWDQQRGEFFFEPAAGPIARAVSLSSAAQDPASAARQWWEAPNGPVVLEEAPSPPAAPKQALESHTLAVTGYTAESVEVHWRLPVAGWLVLAEPWYPGWRAHVDDAWVDVRVANGWMRAVPVPAGERTVRFEFFPRSLWWGAAISTGTAALLLAAWLWTRAKTSSGTAKMSPCPRVGFCP